PAAPLRSGLGRGALDFAGPHEAGTTSPPCASLVRSASSTAFRSVGLSAPSPGLSSRLEAGSIRLWTVASGTCLTQTAILIGPDFSPLHLTPGEASEKG